MAGSYRGLDFTQLKGEAAKIGQRAANRDGNRKPFPKEAFYNLDQGDHDIRILPPGYGDVDFIPGGKIAMVVFDHNNVPGDVPNSNTGRKDRYRCPRLTYPESGISCPICQAISEMYEWFKAAGLTEAEQKAKKSNYYMQRRAYVNAVVRGDKTLRDLEFQGSVVRAPRVRIVGLPVAAIYEPLVQAMVATDDDTGDYIVGDITNPVRGRDVRITVKGSGLEKEYSYLVRDRSELHKDERVAEALMSDGFVISDIFSVPTEKQVDRMRVVADRLRTKVIGSAVEPMAIMDDGSRVPPGEAEPMDLFTSSRPSCYGNHVPKLRKCLICPVEQNCLSEDETQAKDLAERKKFHGAA